MNTLSPSLEEQIKTLQKHFGGIVVTVKALKASVDRLESKVDNKQNGEMHDILEAQKKVNDSIVENANAIKILDAELKKRYSEGDDVMAEGQYGPAVQEIKARVCRYHNRGYCKYKNKCRYIHNSHICKVHEETEDCKDKNCKGRHPKRCKWWGTSQGCRRLDCNYFHVTSTSDDDTRILSYDCISCANSWKDETCVVKHTIKNTDVYFCLNCDDWVQQKNSVLEPGWSLVDVNGRLRRDV